MEIALPRLLILAGELTVRAGDQLVFGPFGLNVPKFSILATLLIYGGTPSMTELREANFIMVSPSSITSLVDDLEARGLLRRIPSPSDRRVSLIEITDEGRRLLDQVMERYTQVMSDYLQDYDTADLRVVIASLKGFIEKSAGVLGISEPHLPPSEKM
ncbi:MarR family transcriptional regulator [bacterium]|nr:MarR family transcriptional regulator [bacterium]MBU1984158.1 MarR family transcriptional regulator [bacterium]